MGRRKKSEPKLHQDTLLWTDPWHPPRGLKVKDVFPHLTIGDNGTLLVRGQAVLDKTVEKHWRLFRDMIDKEDLPKVYKRYKKAIDARRERAG